MVLIVCTDANRGLSFNHRPVSRDSVVSSDIDKEFKKYREEKQLSDTEATGLWPISMDPVDWTDIDKVIIYNFNRVYPADERFSFPADKLFILKEVENFKGSSHECITKEVYYRA